MKYSAIYEYDTINTIEGFNISLFCSGCTHKCKGCYNEKAQSFEYGKDYTEKVENYIIDHLKKPYIRGLSLLGGEIFQNVEGVKSLAKRAKEEVPGKKIWAWSGYTYEEIIRDKDKLELLKYIDILVDGRFVEELKDVSLRLRGSSNQRVLDVQKTLRENRIINYIDD